MTTPPALAERPSSPLDPAPADELSLAALLELFAPEDPAVPPAPSLRTVGARALGWVQQSSRRAAAWGAVGHETTGAR